MLKLSPSDSLQNKPLVSSRPKNIAISCKPISSSKIIPKKHFKSSKSSFSSTSKASAALKAALLAQTPKSPASNNNIPSNTNTSTNTSSCAIQNKKPIPSKHSLPVIKPSQKDLLPSFPNIDLNSTFNPPIKQKSPSPTVSTPTIKPRFVPIRPIYRPLLPKPSSSSSSSPSPSQIPSNPSNSANTASLTCALRRAAAASSKNPVAGSAGKSAAHKCMTKTLTSTDISRTSQSGNRRASKSSSGSLETVAIAIAASSALKPVPAKVSKKSKPLVNKPLKKVTPLTTPSTTSLTTFNAQPLTTVTTSSSCPVDKKMPKNSKRPMVSIAPSILVSKKNPILKPRRASSALSGVTHNLHTKSGSDFKVSKQIPIQPKKPLKNRDLLLSDTSKSSHHRSSSVSSYSSYFVDINAPPSPTSSSSSSSSPHLSAFNPVSEDPVFGSLLSSEIFQFNSISLSNSDDDHLHQSDHKNDDDIDLTILRDIDVDALTSSINLDSSSIPTSIHLSDSLAAVATATVEKDIAEATAATGSISSSSSSSSSSSPCQSIQGLDSIKSLQEPDMDLWLSPESLAPCVDLDNMEMDLHLDTISTPSSFDLSNLNNLDINTDMTSILYSPTDSSDINSSLFSDQASTPSSRASSVDETFTLNTLCQNLSSPVARSVDENFDLDVFDFNLPALMAAENSTALSNNDDNLESLDVQDSFTCGPRFSMDDAFIPMFEY